MPNEHEQAFALVLETFEKERAPGACLVSDSNLIAAAEFIAADEQAAVRLISRLFPSGVPTDSAFYTGLYELERHIGFSQQTALLAGEVSVHALKKMNENQRREVLNAVVEAGHRFFEALRSLPTVITKIRFEPEFVIPWLLRVRQRIGNDMAQGDFWRTVETWSLKHSDDALVGLQQLVGSSLDDDTISIAASILGSLRIAWETKSPSDSGHALENSLLTHTDVQRRLVFHRSWINTGWKRTLIADEFATCLARMSAGTEPERAEAFNFLRCLLPNDYISPESLLHGANWLSANSNSSLPDNSKHWVVNVAHTVVRRTNAGVTVLKAVCDALVAIQPVPTKNAGTWKDLEGLLVDLLEHDFPQFESLLFRLLDANADGVLHYFTAQKPFEWLLSEIVARTRSGWYSALFFSPARHRRRFAFALFDEIPFEKFPEGMLEQRSDDEIALALFEFRLNRLSPEQVLTLFVALLGRVETGATPLKHLYEDELLYQAKNLPGACLERLKPLSAQSELVSTVTSKAEAYFQALRKCHGSPLVAMEVPGLQRSLRIQGARQSRQIHEMSQELSVFAKLFANSYLLYGGKSYRYCRDGELGEVSELQAFSAQSELPRLEIIDPEGAVIRQHDTIESLRQLEAKLTSKRGASDA